MMVLKKFNVYLRGSNVQNGPYLMLGTSHEDAKLQLQKVMRKRFNKELNRDYFITKAVLVRREKK